MAGYGRKNDRKKKRLLPETEAGLEVRKNMVIRYYGGNMAFARHFRLPCASVQQWKKIPERMVLRIARDNRFYPALSPKFCRPDLKVNVETGEIKRRKMEKVYS